MGVQSEGTVLWGYRVRAQCCGGTELGHSVVGEQSLGTVL